MFSFLVMKPQLHFVEESLLSFPSYFASHNTCASILEKNSEEQFKIFPNISFPITEYPIQIINHQVIISKAKYKLPVFPIKRKVEIY